MEVSLAAESPAVAFSKSSTQSFPGLAKAGLHGFRADGQGRGNLAQSQPLTSVEVQHLALTRRQCIHCLQDPTEVFANHQVAIRRDGGTLVVPVQQLGSPSAAPFAAEAISPQVRGNCEEPNASCARISQPAAAAPCPEKGLLREVLRFLTAPRQPQRKPVHARNVFIHDTSPGRSIAKGLEWNNQTQSESASMLDDGDGETSNGFLRTVAAEQPASGQNYGRGRPSRRETKIRCAGQFS